MTTGKKAVSKADQKLAELIKNFNEFINEFKNETDRAAVVLGAAKLDYLLYQILLKYLLPNATSKDDLFDGDAPLSTFSSKINMAYRLGLIDNSFARALHLIRRIRNSFAHEVSGNSLDSGHHRDRVKELVSPYEALKKFSEFQEAFFKDKKGLRADFYTILGMLVVRFEHLLDAVTPLSGKDAWAPTKDS